MTIGQWTTQWLQSQGHPVHYFPTTTSTNLLAKEQAIAEREAVVFYITDDQSQGRGQGTNQWLNSHPGTNLLFTGSLKSLVPPQPELCLVVGQHLMESCRTLWPDLEWRVKPPNDLFLFDKKVSGILLESVSQGSVHRLLLGIGFNVLAHPNHSSFEATSLSEHLSTPLLQQQWNQFLHVFLQKVLGEIPIQ